MYGVQDDLSIEEPSAALPPAASLSNLDMPPPYEAVSGGSTRRSHSARSRGFSFFFFLLSFFLPSRFSSFPFETQPRSVQSAGCGRRERRGCVSALALVGGPAARFLHAPFFLNCFFFYKAPDAAQCTAASAGAAAFLEGKIHSKKQSHNAKWTTQQ